MDFLGSLVGELENVQCHDFTIALPFCAFRRVRKVNFVSTTSFVFVDSFRAECFAL